jgi:hypothetical protein
MGFRSLKTFGSAFIFIALASQEAAFAQGVLPQGIGIFKAGHRYMINPSRTFDDTGKECSLGDVYSKNFSGPEMLKGTFGEDLKQLATWINKYDSGARGGLLDRLTLGKLSMDVKTKLQISLAGLGLGVTNWLTVYAGAPYINVDVDASLGFSGENTALQIKNELGDLIPTELEEGLERAKNVNVNDILNSFSTNGYSTNFRWKKQTWGDTKVGVFLDPLGYQGKKSANHELTLNLELSIPTGYLGKPEILVDTDLGRGYYQVYGEISDKHTISYPFFLSYLSATALGVPAKRKLRVPIDDSAFPAANRLAEVTIHPGIDYDFRLEGGASFSAFEPFTTIRFEGHTKDRYSGGMAGNYEKLSEGSNFSMISSETGIHFSTVNAYKSKEFPIPFLAKISWKHPWMGYNKMSDDYVELALTAFFPTPFMEDTPEIPKPLPETSEPVPETVPETVPEAAEEPIALPPPLDE